MRITLFLLSLRLEQHHPTHTDKHNRQFQRSLDNVGRPCLKKKKNNTEKKINQRGRNRRRKGEKTERETERGEKTLESI